MSQIHFRLMLCLLRILVVLAFCIVGEENYNVIEKCGNKAGTISHIPFCLMLVFGSLILAAPSSENRIMFLQEQ